MSLKSDKLANKIVTAANNEVQRCTDEEGNFNPNLFNKNFYLQEIYNFLVDNIEVTVTYTGTIPGVGPDPGNGNHKFSILPFSTQEIIPKSDSTDFTEVFSDWWIKLFTSFLLNTSINNSDSEESLVVLTASPLVGFPKPPTPPVVSSITSDNGYIEVWKAYSNSIIEGIESMTILDFTVPSASATSSNGGSGTIVPVSVNIKD